MDREDAIDRPGSPALSWLACVAGDVHFWVPTMVLVGGLLLLRWVS